MIRVNLNTLHADDTPLPEVLAGLLQESLYDLSWTDESLGLRGFGWWPVHVQGTPSDEEHITGYTYVVDAAQKLVSAIAIIEPLPLEVLRPIRKAKRQAAVDSIKVTTSTGKTFDGDEISQGRMARAIIAMQAIGTSSVLWVLADNTPTEATVQELVEALALAGTEQSPLWSI